MSLRYQPIVRLADGSTVAFEALLRWRHPEHGFVPPEAFLPLAAENGVLLPITRWVLRSACAEAVRWDEASSARGSAGVGVTVNLSVGLSKSAPRRRGRVDARAEWVAGDTADARDHGDGGHGGPGARAPHHARAAVARESALHSTTSAPVTRRSRTSASSRSTCSRSPSRSSTASAEPADTMFVDAILRLGRALGMGAVAEGVEMGRQSGRLCSRLAATSARASGSHARCTQDPFVSSCRPRRRKGHPCSLA